MRDTVVRLGANVVLGVTLGLICWVATGERDLAMVVGLIGFNTWLVADHVVSRLGGGPIASHSRSGRR